MAKAHLVAIVCCSLLVTPLGWAQTPSPSLVATPPQPKWSELSVQQRILLAPLADDWDSMEYYRQKKWLGIAARFPAMSSEEQRRIQSQMQEWGKLTPKQRELARENFKTAQQLPPEKKQELKQKWQEYLNLPPEEKERLKQEAQAAQAVAPTKPTRPGLMAQEPMAQSKPVTALPLLPLPAQTPAPVSLPGTPPSAPTASAAPTPIDATAGSATTQPEDTAGKP